MAYESHTDDMFSSLPLGAITIGVIILFFKAPERKEVAKLTWTERLGQLDLPGTAVFMPAVISLLIALQWGGSKYDWNDGRIIALFVLFGVLIIFFISIQLWKQDNAVS